MAPPDLLYLALLARLYHGVQATSCQAKRNFFALSLLIGTLRASMSPCKEKEMMFLKLNQGCLQKYNAVVAARQERLGQFVNDVNSAQKRRLLVDGV